MQCECHGLRPVTPPLLPMKMILKKIALSVLTVWLFGTAIVICSLVIGIICNTPSSDPTGLLCQH